MNYAQGILKARSRFSSLIVFRGTLVKSCIISFVLRSWSVLVEGKKKHLSVKSNFICGVSKEVVENVSSICY